jgi:hypothetical protein
VALEARHPTSIVGGDDPLAVLARGTLIELGPAIVRIRLDEGAEPPPARETVVVIVHRTKVEMVLGTVDAGGESDPRLLLVTRVARAD